ncbi:MAG: hypothetical protein HY644_02675 [Acidobacteria bacterium]|nr:hypothetical protein [Acidobacteriota bacterium]
METSEKAATSDWFDLGAKALRQTVKDLPELYACPLCLHGFEREQIGYLTREHVPPACFGGEKLILTCGECNTRARHSIDAELGKFIHLRKFVRREMDEMRQYKVTMNGTTANVLVRFGSDKCEVVDFSNRNSPVVSADLRNHLDIASATASLDWGFKMSPVQDRYRIGWPEVSLLRAVYLAAFAKFGYAYIMRPALDTVRKQIRQPEKRLIKYFLTPVVDAPDETRVIAYVQKPEWMRCLMAQIGQFRIFLPFFDEEASLYKRLSEAHNNREKTKVSATLLPWPRTPEFLLDFHKAAVVRRLRPSDS